MPRPRLFLVDAFGFIFRAYHARARTSAPPMRTSKGLSTEAVYIFHNMMRRLVETHAPEYLAAIFESTGKTFREQQFTEYKANRSEMPPDLAEQIPWIRRLLEAQRVALLEYEGFEADDVIGTLARQAAQQGVDVVIVSSDKDLLQLVGDHIFMLNPMKNDTLYDAEKTREFLGVPPHQVADLLALKGDAIDNIPGAPGIGDKGACELLKQFGSLQEALDRASEVSKKTYRESLQKYRDQILLSRELATIRTDIPLSWNLESLIRQPPDVAKLKQIYRELEFFSLAKELGPQPAPSEGDWATLSTEAEFRNFIASLDPTLPVAIALSSPSEAEFAFGSVLGLAQQPGRGRAFPFQPASSVREFLASPALQKITHNWKSLQLECFRHGMSTERVVRDIMLEAFLLSADPSVAELDQLCERYLDRRLSSQADQRAACVVELAADLAERMKNKPQLENLYREIELPLAEVLARMEYVGIRIETSQLARLSTQMDAEIQRLTAEIHQLAGRPFNINSPQQLAKVLFEEMGLPAPARYGKGKQVSTAAEVLEEMEHPIAAKVLEYRQLTKLKGTYVDALPQRIDSQSRLHTSFHQTGAATGRLSSSDPNLQNIPIRTELGRAIRAAFVPEPGWKLIVADYSQIELRLLAHLSGDPVLVDSFRKGEDIHTRTASEVFGVPSSEVTAELRRNAKAVNFGIVYGQTPFGLATQLGIPRQQAELYILNYFERYRGVKDFIEETIRQVRQSGVSRTIFGRERPIPDINSRNPSARAFAERTAVNTPLQGAAADLIKLAMVRIDRRLRTEGWKTRMLLQVHDELVFESPPAETEKAADLIRQEMESVQTLQVPLVVETGIGDNWRDAK
ncbi:MAG: DNA polymerase I [Bryobacteraceae bacterium]|nr:DNA polymerase I [Bryobacteraceae bacterium]MDW8379319.1 DNA polymerase I [Bryobacterales bacterium]